MRKIYLASSWRNAFYPEILKQLRLAKHEVYDFRNPGENEKGFAWRDINLDSKMCTPETYLYQLKTHPKAAKGFNLDFNAMKWCDTLVLLLPSGRSAHAEAGWAAGQGKETFVLLNEQGFEPELMYLLFTDIFTNLNDLIERLK